MLSSSQFHSDFATWTVSTHEIGINGLNLSRSLSIDALNAALKEDNNELFSWRLIKPGEVKFKIIRENDKTFKVHLSSDLVLSCSCVRCLEPVSFEIALDFEITMMEGSKLGPDDTPINFTFDSDCVESLSDEDTAVGYFLGRSIDLGLILREEVFLEVPDYPECQSPKAMGEATCKQAEALLSTQMSTRENPFVKFWKTN